MAQKKLLRFSEIKKFPNVLEYPQGMKGQWKEFFHNDHPVILELACGRGEYTIGLAQLYPGKNFIGLDIKGNRMYIGAKKALDTQLSNTAFLRTQIEMLPNYFEQDEVDEIWIIFPDPHLRTSKAKKRLTHPRFLRLYEQILKRKGRVHLKTDSPELYQFTKRVIEMYGLKLLKVCDDVYNKSTMPELKIRTHYEGLDIAKSDTIYYLSFSLPTIVPALDDALQKELKQTENKQSV